MIGQTIAQYRVERMIGHGGMGEVYRAEDTRLDRTVALKFMPPGLQEDPVARKRFMREAKSAAAIDHPFICKIFEVGEFENCHFIAMEYVSGQTLEATLGEKRLEPLRAIAIAIEICEALQEAHQRGIVHRDLKPSNIMLTRGGHVKVMDFGLAKRLAPEISHPEDDLVTGLTAEGAVIGTVPYMAPEQILGQELDGRSDLFSFGILLYEMLCGVHPFRQGSALETLASILQKSPQPLSQHWPGAPQLLQQVVHRLLSRDREQRYASATEVEQDLRQVLAAESGTQSLPALGGIHPRLTRDWWIGVLLAGLGGLALLAWLWLPLEAPPAPASSSPRVRPLTSFVGWEAGPSWSPDGSFLAYSHTNRGPKNLFVMATGGGEPFALTHNRADDDSPRWSPDGRSIAFVSDRGRGTDVFLIPPLGGVEHKLVETGIPWLERTADGMFSLGAQPWSPSSNQILFSRLQPEGSISIWKVDLTSGAQEQLTSPPPGTDDLSASWSSDGELVVFQRRKGGNADLWVIPAAGGQERAILEGEFNDRLPVWDTDNDEIIFSSNRSGAMNLWRISFSSGDLQQLTTGPGPDNAAAVARNRSIAFVQTIHQVDLFSMSVSSEQEEMLASHMRDNFGPRYSPDGGKILYHSNRTGNLEIWEYDLASRSEQQLTNAPAQDFGADFSPDGSQIAFISNREGPFQLWRMNARGGEVVRLSEQTLNGPENSTQGGQGALWSPDGKAIGYISAGMGGWGLWTVDSDGGNPRELLSGVLAFDWYQDGRHVVWTRYARDSDEYLETLVTDLDTGQEVVLFQGRAIELRVSPDGSAISFCDAASHLDMQLFVLPLEPPRADRHLPRAAGEPRQLTRGEGLFHVHNGGWSPDSQSVVYSRDTDQGDIFLLER